MIMDRFFTQTHCDRCHSQLSGIRTMSKFNTQCICLSCSEKESDMEEYRTAVEADEAEIRRGNFNFKGMGFPKPDCRNDE